MTRNGQRSNWKSKQLQWLAVLAVLGTQGFSSKGLAADSPPADTADACIVDALCRANYQRARILSRDGEHESALAAYRAAYRRRPVGWLLLNIGRTLHKLNRFKEAMEYYQQYSEQNRVRQPDQEARLKDYLKEVQEDIAAAQTRTETPPAAASTVTSAAKATTPEGSEAAAAHDGQAAAASAIPSASGHAAPPAARAAVAAAPAPSAPAGGATPALAGHLPIATAPARPSRGVGLGMTLTLTGAIGVAALGTGIAALQSASQAQGTVFIGDQPPAELLESSERAHKLSLASNILIGAGVGTLVIGLLATYLRKPSRPPVAVSSVWHRGAALALHFP